MKLVSFDAWRPFKHLIGSAQHVKDMVFEFSTGTMATVFPESSEFAGM
jgi:hypothetical protein